MNEAFARVLAASPEDRRGLFTEAARRIGTSERYVEKDFWVCWTLDALFNDRPAGEPRLLFKGGTSLSKAFGLISRFSEDIDITVFRDDLGDDASIEAMEAMSGKARSRQLDAIREHCSAYITGPLYHWLSSHFADGLAATGIKDTKARVAVDSKDPDGQTLLLWYPSLFGDRDTYVSPAVRIESGAKSALDPHVTADVAPYVTEELGDPAFAVANITTVSPKRTLWDKIIILHGLKQWFDRRGVVRQEGQRITRHYYDVYRVLGETVGQEAVADRELARDCARHARMFFNRPDLNLDAAVAGNFTPAPSDAMLSALERDYTNMLGMIFGEIPQFSDVVDRIRQLENELRS
jgi:hypothetical protein